MSFNKITIVGNLGRDPELRYTPQNMAVCNISVATSEKRRDSKTGDLQDITTWFRVTLWGKQAEAASKYLTKGRPVYIEGRLRVDEWTDRDGGQRYTLEVNATDMQFIDSRGSDFDGGYSDNAAAGGGSNYSGGGSNTDDNFGDETAPPKDDDIPF